MYEYIFVIVNALTSVPLYWLHLIYFYLDDENMCIYINICIDNILCTINIWTNKISTSNKPKKMHPIQAAAAPPQLPLWAASGFFFLAKQSTGVASTISVSKDIHRSYTNIINICNHLHGGVTG